MFLWVGLGSLLWLIPWLLIARSEASASDESSDAGPGWGDLLRCPQVWAILRRAMFALGYVNYFFLSWLPGYLVTERGLSFADMAVLGSIPFWAMAGASLRVGGAPTAGSAPARMRVAYESCTRREACCAVPRRFYRLRS